MSELFGLSPDDVLRRRGWVTKSTRAQWTFVKLVLVIWIFGMTYGGVMGTFSGLGAGKQLQIVYSATKVPVLLSATFLISLPSFFVLNTLLGVRRDFYEAIRGLLATQAGLAIILASFAPFTALWYASSSNYQHAVLFNLVLFSLASLTGQWLLDRYYRRLVAKNRKHRWLMWMWIAVYALVGIQMAWILRPFVGSPNAPVQFFRPGAWDNAYVIVTRLIWHEITSD